MKEHKEVFFREYYDLKPIIIDLDSEEVQKHFWRWGGQTIFRFCTIENGKKIWSFLTLRVSGDSRGGNTTGIHASISKCENNRDVSQHLWIAPSRGREIESEENYLNELLQDSKTPSKCFTFESAAKFLECSPKTLRREVKRGNLKGFRIGRQWRISPSQLGEYIGEKLK